MISNPWSREQLADRISVLGKSMLENRQVYTRLQRLLPRRYSDLVKTLRSTSQEAGKVRRLALLDQRYIAYVTELNELGDRILKAKIEWEFCRMLFKCGRR
jgi:hypothetical protein